MPTSKPKPEPVPVVDDPIVVSWSEIDAFRQCPFKHHLQYRQRWTSPVTPPALATGISWHSILEAHYLSLVAKRERDTQEQAKQSALLLRLLGAKDSAQTDNQKLLQWMYEGYVQQWGNDPDWDVVAVEWKGLTPLPNPSGGHSRFVLKVKIDLLVKFRRNLWVTDHKSGRDLPTDKMLDLDDQFGLYTWTMRQIGFPVMGSIYNAARTQRNKSTPQPLQERFARTYMQRTDVELDTIAAEAYRTAERMWPEGGLTHTPERNTDPDRCRWRCGMNEACLASRKGIDIRELLHAYGFRQEMFRQAELDAAQQEGR